jgi:UDP:flavonoid glycosyltransferase YjiC (YdhE family)
VAEFEYPRSDTPLPLHFLGPLGASGSTAALPAWWPDLDDGRPVVHVTQGTIANDDLTQLARPTMEALADEDVLVVVSTGGRPLDGLGLLPANARAADYLPYDELLPRTAAFVTNGGYGGVHYALRYGVPIVVTGGQEDKPEVGARVAWSGVGYRFKQERPTPDELRKAIREVLTNDNYQANAQRLAQSMTASPGMSGFTALLDDLVTRHRETSVV